MNGNRQSPIFELFDTTLAATIPGLVGLWTTRPADMAINTEIAFALNSETVVNAPVWRANFPTDLNKASLYLTHSEEILIRSQQALSTASDRVDRLMDAIASESTLAFSLSALVTELAPPERTLLQALQTIQQPLPTSFGIQEAIGGYSQQVFEQCQSFVERLLRVIAHYAWVETQVAGQTLARTAVSWLGDVDNIWQTGLNATQVSLHQRTLTLALASRDALLQTFSAVVQATLKVSVLLSVPGGVILLLPAVWKFIDQVMTQSNGGLAP
ncbi:MAG: hypothetical protein V7K89_08795 [Nostoc sp.]|uniref:hypothetical protein n=1 Tax=Nostoc sp. TaxID=1180 RepID=UPI002FF87718